MMRNTKTLFTQTQFELLTKNGASPDQDYAPVVKLVMTGTPHVWLLSELNPLHPDIAFGCCDLGYGCPELGYVDISQILDEETTFCKVGRDLSFDGRHPMSVYSRAVRKAGRIVDDEQSLLKAQPKPML